MTKELNKEVMARSRLRNKFPRFRSGESKKAYNEEHNRCVNSLEMPKNLIIAILKERRTLMIIKNFGK